MKVFVYGTLKPGYHNYRIIEPFVVQAQPDTVRDFTLIDLGHFPGAVPSKDLHVNGVVLTINDDNADEALARLDRLEVAPRLYRREQVTTEGGDSAWFYVFNRPVHLDRSPKIGDTWPRYDEFVADCNECFYGDCKEPH